VGRIQTRVVHCELDLVFLEVSTRIRIVSYNLREHSAAHELTGLVSDYDLDVLCLQECDTTLLPTRIGGLVLADATKLNRLGLAIYFREDRFTGHDTKSFALKKSLHDRVMSPAHERVIATRMFDNKDSREFVVASFHAAPLTATNSLRRTQIKAAHEALRSLGSGLPSVMMGDFNYPLFRNNLNRHMLRSGYDMSLSDRPTYIRYKFYRGHFDFVTSVGMTVDNVETLPRGISDHLPILTTARFKA
jgi:endonuclease/exonuclease/phosphatase family metal-dependent hydrolase